MIKILNKKNTNQILILVMLALFTVSVGLWGNYRQLWLATNSLSAASISRVISIASIVAALSLLFYTKKVSISKLKIGMLITLIIKLFISILLLLIDGSNNLFMIKFLSFFDIACENIIISSVYPFIMCYQKSDELYGKKSVVENLGKTLGVLIGCLLFGRVIFSYKISYRACLIISILFNFLSLFVLAIINDNKKIKVDDEKDSFIKYLLKNKILLFFLGYNCLTNVSYSIILGLKMLMLTDFIHFSTSVSTSFILIFSILDIIFGALAINILRSKNDYVNMSVKFLARLLLLLLVVLTNNIYVLLLTMAYCLLTNTAYGSVISGFMTNSIHSKYILDFTVFNYITNLIGEAIGIFIAGSCYGYGFKYICISGGIIMFIQLIMAYYIIYRKRKSLKHSH